VSVRAGWRPGLLAVPYLVGLALTIGLPVALAIGLAFTDYHGFTAPEFVGLSNLTDALRDEQVAKAARNTLILVAMIVPVRLLIAVGAAIFLSRTTPGTGAARAAVFLPSVVPDTAWALLWLWLLNPQFGPLSNVVGGGLGLLTEEWPTRVGIAAMLGLQVGESFVVCLAARRVVPNDVYEAAAVEGARPWFVLRRITLPIMAPIVGLLAVRDIVLVATATFIPILLVTEGGPRESTVTLPLHLYLQGFRYGDLGYVCMLSMVLFVVTATVVLPFIWMYGRRRQY